MKRINCIYKNTIKTAVVCSLFLGAITATAPTFAASTEINHTTGFVPTQLAYYVVHKNTAVVRRPAAVRHPATVRHPVTRHRIR
ncbi:MAG: hypothetical protein ACHP65_08685 [Legionellales bacterium]